MSAIDFSDLLSGITALEHLRPLLRALGFGREWLELPAESWPESIPTNAALRVIMAGERSGLQAIVMQLDQLNTSTAARVARRVRTANPARLTLFVFTDTSVAQIGLGSFGASEDLRLLFIECARVRASDQEALTELVPSSREGGLVLALRQARVLDRSRMTRRFFLDFRAQRNVIAAAWRGLPRSAEADRRQLALLFLCRLMFLYFLQRRGHLTSDPEYVYRLWQDWQSRRHTKSFYKARIKALFFGVLNRRPEQRTGASRRLGELPYLNGGLFDRHALERRHRSLDLPDRAVRAAFDDLLQRYRFTTQDAAEATAARTTDAAIDPEMLGRVFEELMSEAQRGDTGTYFTPPEVVDRLVVRAVQALVAARGHSPQALRNLRVLDPACGSGAFLLGALNRIAEARAVHEGATPECYKRELVEQALHGVDLQDDAALLCALRLWLCLLPAAGPGAEVQPLPNLDRRIRQGDSLIDPLDLAVASVQAGDQSRAIAANPVVRAALHALQPAAARYVTAEPAVRQSLSRELQDHELKLARAWVACLRELADRTGRELRAAAAEIDLFGERTRRAQDASTRLQEVEGRALELEQLTTSLEHKRALPFFSFGVHFPEAAQHGFDLVLSNPPWVRAHRWPASLGRVVRERYEVCRASGWKPAGQNGKRLTGAQVDLSLLFLERSLRLLASNGALAMLLPAKVFRSLYAGGARALLLRQTAIVHIEDHSLDQRSIFRANAFAGAIVAVKRDCTTHHDRSRIRVSCHQRHAPLLDFELEPEQLCFDADDPASPWLLVPPDVGASLRVMRAAGPPIGAHADLRIQRGVFTGANDVLLIDSVQPKLGDYAWIRAEGYAHTPAGQKRAVYRALIEDSVLRPVVAGAEVRAWNYQSERAVFWADPKAPMPRRAGRYLVRHSARLQARTGWRAGKSLGTLFGASDRATTKLVWRDLAPTLAATVLPPCIHRWGADRELVPLNTLYYFGLSDFNTACLLAAYFNSLPVRTFARAIAERAKDAHFRFFGWTIAQLPLPLGWQTSSACRLVALACSALERGSIWNPEQQELDDLVCRAYRLSNDQRAALIEYDHWLGAAHR